MPTETTTTQGQAAADGATCKLTQARKAAIDGFILDQYERQRHSAFGRPTTTYYTLHDNETDAQLGFALYTVSPWGRHHNQWSTWWTQPDAKPKDHEANVSIIRALEEAAAHNIGRWRPEIERGVKLGVTLQQVPCFEALDLLDPQRKPRGGDAVRLTNDWSIAKAGTIGVLSGNPQKDSQGGSITFRASTYRDNEYIECSGGPATIHTDASELCPTGQFKIITSWRFRNDLSGADRGADFPILVPLWDWTPNE